MSCFALTWASGKRCCARMTSTTRVILIWSHSSVASIITQSSMYDRFAIAFTIDWSKRGWLWHYRQLCRRQRRMKRSLTVSKLIYQKMWHSNHVSDSMLPFNSTMTIGCGVSKSGKRPTSSLTSLANSNTGCMSDRSSQSTVFTRNWHKCRSNQRASGLPRSGTCGCVTN